jgi:hypothetical protein
VALKEIRYNPATFTFLSVVSFALKNSHTQKMFLRINSTGRYTHHKQVNLEYYYTEKDIAKSKSSCLSYSAVVSLLLESILSKISDMKQICLILSCPLYRVHRSISSAHTI